MWGELRTTYFRGNEHGRGSMGFEHARRFWLGSYRLAREVFGEPFGSLDVGAPADFIVLDTFQKTPLTADTWLSHLLYNFHPWDIDSVYVGGHRVYRTGDAAPLDPVHCQQIAEQIWSTMSRR
jgi:cytosine/adenosine deaminase-related metal-dependent hydrolase